MLKKWVCAKCNTIAGANKVKGTRRFMRHGKTQMNLDSICVGSIDEPLCRLGEKQAQKAADEFYESGVQLSAICSSPLQRAFKTGEILATRLGVRHFTEQALQERNVGEIQGKPETPESDSLLLEYYYLPEGATPLEEFEKETEQFLGTLRSEKFGRDALLVTHGFRMLTIVKLIKGWDVKQIEAYAPPENCQIITFGIGIPCDCQSQFYELK